LFSTINQDIFFSDENAPRSKKQKLNFSEIKCICFNVCGIKSKLVLPEFMQLITTHDICIFIETNTDKYDILNIPDGFSYVALKSPTSAHFMSFSIKFTNSFSISKNASIDEYREFSGGMYY
jgi:hypothetical protein